MNDEQARAAGLRWLAAGGPWLDGMLPDGAPQSGRSWSGTPDIRRHRVTRTGLRNGARRYDGFAPDFRDGATRGAALEWLREQWDCPVLSTEGVRLLNGSTVWTWIADHTPVSLTVAALYEDTEPALYPAAAEALKEQR